MCGRYSIAVEPTEIEERFRAEYSSSEGSDAGGMMRPRYNAAPSQRLPVILNADPRKVVFSHWGIKPAWMTRLGKKDGLINVRLETLRDKHTFRADLAERRCLIPADGFYEWSRGNTRDFAAITSSKAHKESRLEAVPGRKVPFRITRKDGKLFAFAGIWEEPVGVGGGPRSPAGVRGDFAAGTRSALQNEPRLVASPPRFAIITTAANELMQPIHSRMPVILDEEEEKAWLSGSGSLVDMIRLLESPPAFGLRAYEVSRAVNRASVDVPDLIKPVTDDFALRSD